MLLIYFDFHESNIIPSFKLIFFVIYEHYVLSGTELPPPPPPLIINFWKINPAPPPSLLFPLPVINSGTV